MEKEEEIGEDGEKEVTENTNNKTREQNTYMEQSWQKKLSLLKFESRNAIDYDIRRTHHSNRCMKNVEKKKDWTRHRRTRKSQHFLV